MDVYQPMPSHLASARLSLAPWRDEDLVAYHAMVHERDPRTAAAPRAGGGSPDELRAGIARQQTSLADTGIGLLTVRLNDDFIGYCGLIVGRASLAEPEIGYELLRRTHGNGYATEAGRAIVTAAAGTGRRRLWASVRPWNEASLRVLGKLGFHRTNRTGADDFGELVWCTRTLVPPVGPRPADHPGRPPRGEPLPADTAA
ncbi:MAG: GNAT family N-acetyltransferase [Jatrophihabitans sp.]